MSAAYGRRLLECLVRAGAAVHLVVSEAGQKVIAHELQIPLDLNDGEILASTPALHAAGRAVLAAPREQD